MAEPGGRPAFYAARSGGWRGWWTVLHPPYTAWHLSYVVIGAALAPRVDGGRLLATLVAFFFAVGVAAHALDELRGHPLRSGVPDRVLAVAGAVGLASAVAIGVAGLTRVGPVLAPFILVGPVLVLGYDLELFGGRLHTDLWFALSWGAFPLLTGYVAQAGRLGAAAMIGAAGAATLAHAQRSLSTPARLVRRRVSRVDGALAFDDGTVLALDDQVLLRPLERALRSLSWSLVLLAVALATSRLL